MYRAPPRRTGLPWSPGTDFGAHQWLSLERRVWFRWRVSVPGPEKKRCHVDQRLRRIAAKLAIVPGLPGRSHSFGEERHRFRLGAPLPEARVALFEREHGVRLPEEYRGFLRTLGHGGAGPYYGLLRLEKWAAAARRTCPDRWLARPFPLAATERYGPEWLKDPGFGDPDEPYAGTLPIAHQGCAYYSVLVVTGPARGRIASLDLDRQPPKFCADTGFLAWYERWLDEIAAGYNMGWFGTTPPGDDDTHITVLDNSTSPLPKARAIAALRRRPAYTGRVRGALARAAADENSDVRQAAVAALGKQPDRAAERLLRTALADPEASVRSAALRALDRRGTAWHPAAIMLLTDPASNVRMTAILVLDHSGALAEDHLIGRAADPDTGIRRQALWLLSQRESPRTADVARPLLTDPDPWVRLGALDALHRTSLLTAADVATLSGDTDDRVRAAARRTLTRPGRSPGARTL
jgi:hypothetical protein